MLTQSELAELAGLSLYTVHAAEHGRNVSPKTGRALVEALGVPPSELLPKALASQPSAEDSPELRRTLILMPVSAYISVFADKIEQEMDAGRVTPAWGLSLLGEATGLTKVFNEMVKSLPVPLSDDEIQELDELWIPLQKLFKAQDKLSKLLESVVSERERREQMKEWTRRIGA